MTLKRMLLASALALPLVLSAAQAKADPISSAIVATIGLTGKVAAVATFVVNTALYTAANWAISKLTRPKQVLQDRQASVTSLSLGETPREVIVGTACTGGTLVDAFNFGGKYGTDTVTRCIALADHEVDALVGYYVYDKYYPFVADGIQPGFSNQLSIEFKNARSDGWLAPSHVRANGGWTTSDRMCGITHVWVDTRYDDKVWTQGHPKLKFVVRGLKCYDPRKDASLGYTGSNPHVWTDPSTYQYTENAQVLRYAFQRGIYATGKHGEAKHLLFGRGLSAVEAPPERIISAANVCDEVVDGEARYTANGVISASQSFVEVEEMFAAAMAGIVVQREGGLEIEPGQAKAAVVTITDADLVSGTPVQYDEFRGDSDGGRINTVVPRYIEPAQGYKDHSGPVHRSHSDIAADGGPRETTLALALVTRSGQAGRCAEIERRLARLERRATITLPPSFSELEEGDWIAWQSDRYHDGATVRYRVETWELGEDWRQRLTLREIASSVFGVTDPVEDKASPPPAPVAIDAISLTGVTAEAISLGGDNGLVPAVRFRWDTATADTSMIAIRAEVRQTSSTEASSTRTEDIDAGEMVVTNGVGPNLSLQARLVPIGGPTRPVLPTAWITLSTTELKASDVVSSSATILGLKAQIDDAFGDIWDLDEGLNEARELLADAGDLLDEARDDLDQVEAEIASARGASANLGARIAAVDTARENGDSALASSVSGLSARTSATEADIYDLEQGLASETNARVVALSSLGARTTAAESSINTLTQGLADETSARSSAISSLSGRTGAVEADVFALEQAVADEGAARAESINTLTARIATRPNLVTNSTAAEGMAGLYAFGSRTVNAYPTSPAGPAWSASASDAVSESFGAGWSASIPATEGLRYSLQAEMAGWAQASGEVRVVGLFKSATGVTLDAIVVRHLGGAFALHKHENVLAPPGTVRIDLQIDTFQTSFGTNGSAAWRRIKLEQGAVCTAWTDDASLRQLSSSVSELSFAQLDLETNLGAAGFRRVVTGGSGAPAVFEMFSSDLGGYAALAAPIVALANTSSSGSPLIALEAVDGRVRFAEPISVIKGSRRVTLGPGFGTSNELVLWAGPTSVGYGAETVENGILGISDTDGFFGGKTSNGPFDSGTGPDTVLTISTSWVTIAEAQRYLWMTGQFVFTATWQGQLFATPPLVSGPAYGVEWRLISTALDGSDVRVVASGSTNGEGDTPMTNLGAAWTQSSTHTGPRGMRRLRFQLRVPDAGLTASASARRGRVWGAYYQT